MRGPRRLLLAGAAVLALGAKPALAEMPVIDAAAIAKAVQQLRQLQ